MLKERKWNWENLSIIWIKRTRIIQQRISKSIIWREPSEVWEMIKIEWKEKKMSKQRKSKNGKADPITLSKKETSYINKCWNQRDRINSSSLQLVDSKISFKYHQPSRPHRKKIRSNNSLPKRRIMFKETHSWLKVSNLTRIEQKMLQVVLNLRLIQGNILV